MPSGMAKKTKIDGIECDTGFWSMLLLIQFGEDKYKE
jgi:hypothetical protein